MAQVAHQKWANEWITHFLSENHSGRSFFWKKPAIRSEKQANEVTEVKQLGPHLVLEWVTIQVF